MFGLVQSFRGQKVCTLAMNLEVILLFAFLVGYSIQEDAESHRLKSLPGLEGNLSSAHYTGYLNAGGEGRQFFYWLVESESDPVNDPIIFWLVHLVRI